MGGEPTQSSGNERGARAAADATAQARRLPAVGKVLESPVWTPVREAFGAALVTDLLREELERLRVEALAGPIAPERLEAETLPDRLAAGVAARARELLAPSPRLVVNATGVVAHTNLGRSVLSEPAARRVAEAAAFYMDLEYDLREGRRGSRHDHLAPLLKRLFPGYAAFVVNNNASAVLLALHALARGREVVVSRGELVEIGGSFRVPEVLAASGAKLREVGTTNRTRVGDYEAALTPRTGAILKVHQSNFRIVGFTEEASIRELSDLARGAAVPLVVDGGSGDLVDLAPLGIRDEWPVTSVLSEGADLVTFSGDKLLGGAQAGLAVGRPDLVRRLQRDPLARAVRIDRIRIAALHETLSAYVRGRAFEEVPTLRMLALRPEEIGERAERLRREVVERTGLGGRLHIVDGVSRTGGGSSPLGELPTRLLEIRGTDGDAMSLERALRRGEPPIIGRIHEGRVLLDLRTVMPSQDDILSRRLVEVLDAETARRATR